MPDWYRATEWNDQTEAEFFRRLKRARYHKPQYLVIQAGTLVGTGQPELATSALNLIDLFEQEHFKPFFASGAFQTKAQALLILDRLEEAFDAYEQAIGARRATPNMIDSAWLDYPLIVARRRARHRYQRALDVLNEFMSPAALMLPIYEFRYFAALALISADQEDHLGASRWARNALAAATKAAPFSRHPDVGLVGMRDADLQIELKRLVID